MSADRLLSGVRTEGQYSVFKDRVLGTQLSSFLALIIIRYWLKPVFGLDVVGCTWSFWDGRTVFLVQV